MAKKRIARQRREESLSRDRIIEASIALLDSSGEGGLTFRALSERLATGPGAIYWHIANKSDLLTAACDAIVARTMNAPVAGATPKATIRALALGMFDAIDAHPWVGSALTRAPGQLPMVRILERIGQQVRALGVPDEDTVGDGVRVAELHPWRRWAERGEHAFRSGARPRQIRLSGRRCRPCGLSSIRTSIRSPAA